MAGLPHETGQHFVLVCLCLSLAIPVELHGTIVEVGRQVDGFYDSERVTTS